MISVQGTTTMKRVTYNPAINLQPFTNGFTWNNGKVYDVEGELVSNPNIWYPSLETWMETKKTQKTSNNMAEAGYKVPNDPKDHKVTCNLTVSANDYEAIKAALPVQYFDQLETKRELAIMHEVMASPGNNLYQKIDNALARWGNEKQNLVRGEVRYKLKYRY